MREDQLTHLCVRANGDKNAVKLTADVKRDILNSTWTAMSLMLDDEYWQDNHAEMGIAIRPTAGSPRTQAVFDEGKPAFYANGDKSIVCWWNNAQAKAIKKKYGVLGGRGP